MRAMVLEAVGQELVERDVELAAPSESQVLVDVLACAVCRTDLHVVDGELSEPKLPLVPGHEIVGVVRAAGDGVEGLEVGERVGIPWLGWTCGECEFCRRDQENLCENARFTGYTLDGGFAEQTLADGRYCFPLPEEPAPESLAPLLCAGLIGYRTLRMAGDVGGPVGLYGFGAAAHILAQVLRHEGREFYAFTRPGDDAAQELARDLGATWAGSSEDTPPDSMAASLLFAPVGDLVPTALAATRRGGVVVCGGIHMSDIPSFPYELLWGERIVRSVANLSRRDGEEFLPLAGEIPIEATVTCYALDEANRALADLREGRLTGAAVLVP